LDVALSKTAASSVLNMRCAHKLVSKTSVGNMKKTWLQESKNQGTKEMPGNNVHIRKTVTEVIIHIITIIVSWFEVPCKP
jgi:hypothetical protein